MPYKYLNRFQIILCAECDSDEKLTVNEYTDEVLCTSCLSIEIEKSENELTKQDIEELRGDELRQRYKDEKCI